MMTLKFSFFRRRQKILDISEVNAEVGKHSLKIALKAYFFNQSLSPLLCSYVPILKDDLQYVCKYPLFVPTSGFLVYGCQFTFKSFCMVSACVR